MGFVQLGPPKCQFHKRQKKAMNENKRIEARKTGLNQVQIGFASFYQRFIKDFNKLAKPLTLMVKTTAIWSAKNLLSDITEDVEISSKTTFTNKLGKNLSALVDIAEDSEVDESNIGDDKTVKRSPLSKKPNVPIGYPTSLCSWQKV